MKWTSLMILPAAALSMTVMLGCSEETKGKLSEAADASKDAAGSVGADVKDASGDMLDKAKEVGGDVKDKAGEVMGEVKDKGEQVVEDVKDQLADKSEEVKSEAGDKLVESLGGTELMTQAQDMVAKIKDMIANNNFGDAQAMLDKLKALPGAEKLEGMSAQLESLQSAITKGKELAGQAQGLMGK